MNKHRIAAQESAPAIAPDGAPLAAMLRAKRDRSPYAALVIFVA